MPKKGGQASFVIPTCLLATYYLIFMRIALLSGGPSLERGISLNSARSVLDHLKGDGVEIIPVYFDQKKRSYHISPSALYSNTPSDFDFKLSQTAKPLSQRQLVELLRSTDITFPVIHGPFGEDGELQRFLERHRIPYIGSNAASCKRAFDKYIANEYIRDQGFYTLPSEVLKIYHKDHKKILTKFFKNHHLKKAIIKPASGGSSIGVFAVTSVQEALEKVDYLFSKRIDTRVVIEPFCEGTEFTVIILQNRFGMPVAILPTEIEMFQKQKELKEKHHILDYRKKYLPTNHVKYHCPPRFSNEIVERIQVQAEQLFTILGMRDFARFDGWLMKDGNIWFPDFNPVSGMEQNSFLFQQSARIGMSHRDLLKFVVRNACRRYNISSPFQGELEGVKKNKKPIPVLFGGKTSERQVSLMSGTNVWLKLRESSAYHPEPYLLDLNHNVWHLPYAFTLNHTVEEIEENCHTARENESRLHFLVEKVRLRLALEEGQSSEPFFVPQKISLRKFLNRKPKFLFLGLHGGIGENGTLQKMLSQKKIKYNGSDAKASKLCMDKFATGKKLSGLKKQGIFTAPKQVMKLQLLGRMKKDAIRRFWDHMTTDFETKTVIVKPQDEGCSSGIVRLFSPDDLEKYIFIAKKNMPSIPPETFLHQATPIEMPLGEIKNLMFEAFVVTDSLRMWGKRISFRKKTGWIEITTGVLEEKEKMRALNPSVTVAEGEVLSVEEKFQGGTGINITPPPPEIVKPKVLKRAKQSIELVAKKLGIRGYARIDAFLQIDTGNIIVIEANTLPALTPSTVLFHQGLAEKKPMFPREVLEKLIENKGY